MNGVCSAQNMFVCKKHKPTQHTSNKKKLIQQHRGVWGLQKLLGLLGTGPRVSLWGLSLCNNVPLSGPGVSAPTWFGNTQNLGVSWHQHQLCMTLRVQILWLGALQTLNLYSWEQKSDWLSTGHGLVCLCLFFVSGSISSGQERGDGCVTQNNQGFPLY